MHCNNKKQIIAVSVTVGLIILLLVVICLIYDINKRFPEPSIMTYSNSIPADEDGLIMKPIECRIYTYEEYYDIYGEDGAYAYAKMYESNKMRIVTFSVQIENTTSESITYETDGFQMMGKKSGINNGVLLENNIKNIATIESGEIQQYTLSALILTPSLIKKKWFNRLDEETFYLVYNWYPVIKRLEYKV